MTPEQCVAFALVALVIVGTVTGVRRMDRRDPGWADRMDALRRTTERTRP